MGTSEFTAHPILARATSGSRLEIRYDLMTHAVVFVEDGWSTDGRGAILRNAFREQLDTPKVRRLPRRRAA